jgi:anti-sigma factor ChrR (cupin superfamily)
METFDQRIYETVLAGLVDDPSPVRPTDEQKRKLIEAIEGRHRYAPFTGRVARLFDLDEASAGRTLQALVSPNAWIDGPLPGIRCAPVTVGPGCTGRMNMFIAGDAGARFPIHRHLGEERVLVMQGAFREDDGNVARPGDLVLKTADSAHDFVVLDGPTCVCAYSIDKGFVLV